MVVLASQVLSLEQLRFTAVVVVAVTPQLVEPLVQAGLEVVVLVVLVLHQEQQTQAAAVAVRKTQIQGPQAVQALSFFATPAQFNISLVAQ